MIDPDDGGPANVIFSSSPLEAGVDSATYAAVQGELVRGAFPGYEEISFEVTTSRLPGPCFLRRFRWVPPATDWVPVTQLQMYSVAAGRGYTATATALSTEFDRVESRLHGILDSCAAPAPAHVLRPLADEGPAPTTWQGRLRVSPPRGWLVKESLSLRAADGQGNVTFASEPLEASIGLDEFAAVMGDHMRSHLPHYVEATFGRHSQPRSDDARLRRFHWVPPDGVPVTQLQRYQVTPGRGYVATATCATAAFDVHEAAFRMILDSCAPGVRQCSDPPTG